MLCDTQTTCVNVLQDVGTDIYMYHKKTRLVYQSTVVGAVLKSKQYDMIIQHRVTKEEL